jgi:hypothetical protein
VIEESRSKKLGKDILTQSGFKSVEGDEALQAATARDMAMR